MSEIPLYRGRSRTPGYPGSRFRHGLLSGYTETRNDEPEARNPKQSTRNNQPETRRNQRGALGQVARAFLTVDFTVDPQPSTLNPKPYTPNPDP